MAYLDGRTPNASDVIAAFADAMRRRELIPPNDLIANGKIHRCPVEGARRGKRDGAYALFIDEHPAGWLLNWKDGLGRETWRFSNGTTAWTPSDRAAFNAETAARKKAAEEERQRLAEEARHEAVALFGNADQANPRHPYLVAKGIRAHGVRQRGSELLVPRHDMASGELVGLQRILPDGTKLNLKGGRTTGTWFTVGRLQDRGTILLAEGFASAATPNEITSHPAVVSFGKDNLKAAAVELRRQFPKAKIIICADDDWRQEGNPGLTKAREAALASDAFLVVPKFGPDRGERDKDINDLLRLSGVEAVREAIENAAAIKEKPRLLVDTANPDLTVAALRDILCKSGNLYDRGVPVRLAFDQAQRGMVAQVLTPDVLVLLAHSVCRPYRVKKKADGTEIEVDTRLPRDIATMYLDWRGEWKLPALNGIASAPMLKDDGTILATAGYDQVSGMWCDDLPALGGQVPEMPTKEEAVAALALLRQTFRTFCFADAETVLDHDAGVAVVAQDRPAGHDESRPGRAADGDVPAQSRSRAGYRDGSALHLWRRHGQGDVGPMHISHSVRQGAPCRDRRR